MRTFILTHILFSLLLCNICFGHGVAYKVSQDSTVVISLLYRDGAPMSYAEIVIYSPEDRETEYQIARTDKNGNFAFLPDKDGVWQVKADDGAGHGARIEITVEAGQLHLSENHDHIHFENWINAIFLIIGLAGILLYIQSKRKK